MAVAQEVTSALNHLIETCKDGQDGFETAAKAVDDATLKNELFGFSSQRRNFATELQNLVAWSGEQPKDSGSVSAAVHRGWINIKQAVTGKDAHSILAECERGEDSAVAEYKKAIQAGLPAEYEKVIQTQFQQVQATHDRVKALRDSTKSA